MPNLKIPWDAVLTKWYEDLLSPSFRHIWEALGKIVEVPCYAMIIPTKFAKKQLEKFDKRLNWIPVEDRIPVIPELWIPLLRDLSYYSNEILSNMFIELLAKSADKKTVNDVLPSYIKIIENLSEDEAFILEYIYEKSKWWDKPNTFNIPCISLNRRVKEGDKSWSYITYYSHLSELQLIEKIHSVNNMWIYMENLISLWVLYIPLWISITNEDIYTNLEFVLRNKFPQYFDHVESELWDKEELGISRWLIELTWLWNSFLWMVHKD